MADRRPRAPTAPGFLVGGGLAIVALFALAVAAGGMAALLLLATVLLGTAVAIAAVSLRSAAAFVAGVFGQVVTFFAFYGIYAAEPGIPGRLLALLFITSLAVIGAASTVVVYQTAPAGRWRRVTCAAAGMVFGGVALYMAVALASFRSLG